MNNEHLDVLPNITNMDNNIYMTCILTIDGNDVEHPIKKMETIGFEKLASGMTHREMRFFMIDDNRNIYECDDHNNDCITIELNIFPKISTNFIDLIIDYNYKHDDTSQKNGWFVVDSNVIQQPKNKFLNV